MSIRLASARRAIRRPGWHAAGRGLIAPALARAANDNGDPLQPSTTFDPLLTEALRHFAVHGLAAAEVAAHQAAECSAEGDAFAKDHWLAITQMFDRRLAARAERELAPAGLQGL